MSEQIHDLSMQILASEENKVLRAENATLKSELSKANSDQWIPVGERLPENSGFYLTFDTYSESLPVKMNRFNCPYWQTNDSTVTHWRELPTPPKV